MDVWIARRTPPAPTLLRRRPRRPRAGACGETRRPLGSPPDGGVQVLDLFDGTCVDPRRQVLPAVVADDEDDVALVDLAGDPHRHARDRARGNTREQPLLVEQ